MTLIRIHGLGRIGAFCATTLFVAIYLVSMAYAGPLSGPRQTPPSDSSTPAQQDESNQDSGVTSETQRNITQRELFSSYLEAVRSQVLPDVTRPSFSDINQIDLDGLQGWSLDDIKTAMDAAALGLDQDSSAQPVTEGQPSALTVSVEDLYNFNTGYYFVLDSASADAEGELVSGTNLPEIIGQTALREFDLDIVNLSGTRINLDIETSVGMLDDSFFTSTTASSGSRTIGGRVFRGGGLGLVGGRQSNNPNSSTEQSSLGNFISQSIAFVKDNILGITLVVLGFTGIGYVTSRFA